MKRMKLFALLFVLVLMAACSSPRQVPQVTTVELDGLSTQVVLANAETGTINISCPNPLAPLNPIQVAVTVVEGTTQQGAQYLFYQPTSTWNGSLALFARGYIAPGVPVGFPDPLPAELVALRDALLCQGFALGTSSFSANGLAIEEGIRDTHLLNPLFLEHFGQPPTRTYLMGLSMGGLITVALMELFPHVYDGALPVCGPVAGSLFQLQYIGHVRVLVDYFFPHLFEENAITPTLKTLDEVNAAVDLLDGNALRKLASIRLPGSELFGAVPILPADPMAADPVPSLRKSLKSVLFYYVVGAQDVLNRGNGNPFDNRLTVYTSDQLSLRELVRLNRRVDRFSADTRALRYWTRFYQPLGKLQNPTLNAHTVFDPDVPFAHAALYATLVNLMGASENLLTVPVPGYGHCAFTPEDLARGFGELVHWVETGMKPVP